MQGGGRGGEGPGGTREEAGGGALCLHPTPCQCTMLPDSAQSSRRGRGQPENALLAARSEGLDHKVVYVALGVGMNQRLDSQDVVPGFRVHTKNRR